jgi:hypothetical protein
MAAVQEPFHIISIHFARIFGTCVSGVYTFDVIILSIL